MISLRKRTDADEPHGDPGIDAAIGAEPERDPAAPDHASPELASWEFEEGDEIAPGRSVVRVLGGGRRFEVHLVWDDRLFALGVAKVIRPDQVDDERALRELAEEAQALERLAHPVIVRGFGAAVEGAYPHLLIEHLEGPTLRRTLRRGGPLPLEQLLPLAAHVGAALHYMATDGMLHLDVKPDNIVMGVPPRLIDLSIARSFARAAGTRNPVGTDAYMPPEQCTPREHEGEIGPASDVWGLGATLYHAVAGSVPFPRPKEARHSEDPLVRFPQLAEQPRTLPEGTPPALRDLIMRALSEHPSQRPTAAEMVLELQPLVAALPRKLSFGRRGTRVR